MVAPIAGLIAGFGLMAGRSLFQQRVQRQQDEAFRGALGSLFGVGAEQAPDLAPGQAGPPRPMAIGSNLTEQQTGALEALQFADPELALQMGMAFQQGNRNQQQAAVNQQMDQARLDLQQANLDLAERQFGFDVKQFVAEQNATLQDATDAARVFADPEFALRTSIEAGSDQYVIGNTPDGVPTLADVPGSDAFVQMERDMQESTRTLDNIAEIDSLMREFWEAGSDPNDPIVRRIQGLAAQTRLDIKDSEFNLGALTGPDVSFLDDIMADPTAMTEQMTSNPGAVAQGIAGLQERIGGRAQAELDRTGQWLGTNQELRERAGQALARTSSAIARAERELAAEAEARRAQPGPVGFGEALRDRAAPQGRALLRQLIGTGIPFLNN